MKLVAITLVVLAACSSSKPASEAPPPRDARTATPTPTPNPPPSPITIKVVNQRATPIYVASQTSCRQSPIAIAAPDGRALYLDGQAFPCDTVREGDCPTVGSCPGPGVYRLDPGQSVETTWNATAMTERTLPAADVAPGCPSSCVDWLPVAPGDYTVTAAAWSACPGDCACPGAPAAPCDLSAVLKGAPDLTAKATATMPASGDVVVTFTAP